MAKIQNRALSSVDDLFGITTGEGVDEVDLEGPIRPTVDLRAAMEYGFATFRRYILTVACTAAGNPNVTPANPYTLANWTSIVSNDPGGAGTVVQAPDQIAIVAINLLVGTPGNFTDATFGNRRAADGLNCVWARYLAAGLVDGVGVPSFLRSLPILYNAQSGFPGAFQANVTANTDVTLILDTLSAPRGFLSRLLPAW